MYVWIMGLWALPYLLMMYGVIYHTGIVKFFQELIKTFSDAPSEFTSKRVTQCLLICMACYFMQVYFSVELYRDKLALEDTLLMCAALFGYAGYNVQQIQKDKKTDG